MDSSQIGNLVQELARKEKELHELIVEGNGMVKPLRDIADWLSGLDDPDNPQTLEFEEHNNSFRSPKRSGLPSPSRSNRPLKWCFETPKRHK